MAPAAHRTHRLTPTFRRSVVARWTLCEADGTLEQTALREAWEEVGVVPAQVEIVTTLSSVWIPVSNFAVLPVVGLAATRPTFAANTDEVALVIEASLRALCAPEARQSAPRSLSGQTYNVPFFAIQGHEVWGATALVLGQLINRLVGVRG